ncbi:hypothetical protein Golomagni_00396 [Golovinomyces magnicellulatus]|nr:hypothetical protein Golomagni_00396 [Golovinomyces magnicellulatus]
MANHSTPDQTESPSQPKFSMFHASSSVEAIKLDEEYAAHNYHPLPIVFARASGCDVWDPEGKHYLDFLSAYSAVNQGHCHPKLVQTLCEQAQRLTLSSRAFHNDVFPQWAKKVRSVFNYDMVLPMNTGAEAVETAIKIARKWAYKVKKIPQNKALIFSATGNFHGRTMTAVSLSVDPESRDNYGPYIPGVGACCPATKKSIRFNSAIDLESSFEAHAKVTAAFIVEPIQGEAGVIVPSDNYLVEVYDLCKKYNVLLICDEIQTGIGRTGRNLCSEWAGIKPDMIILGKAISGGMYPVSCVLGSKELMLTIEPGTHGSTFGGNPLGCAISICALEILETENLSDRADTMGTLLRQGLHDLKSPMIKQIRGKGLLNAIVIDETNTRGHSAWDMCILMMKKGLLAKPTHNNIIRLAPPLVVSEEQIREALHIIHEVLTEISRMNDKIENSYGLT